MKTVVLFSGGLDSTVLLNSHVVKDNEVIALFCDYGSKNASYEHQAVDMICDKLTVPYVVVRLPFINELFKSSLLQSGRPIPDVADETPGASSTIVPYRNSILLMIAAGYAESIDAKFVTIACNAMDAAIYPDCKVSFFEAVGETLALGSSRGIGLQVPYITWRKSKIVDLGTKEHAPMELSWSCYRNGPIHCGKCNACLKRQEAFRFAGYATDPTIYAKEDS